MINIKTLKPGMKVIANRDMIEEGQPSIPKFTQMEVIEVSSDWIKCNNKGTISVFLRPVFKHLDQQIA